MEKKNIEHKSLGNIHKHKAWLKLSVHFIINESYFYKGKSQFSC